MAKISKEKWKVYGNVFDEFTYRCIHKLMGQQIIDGIESPVQIGKEANVFTAPSDDGYRILKIYRLESCNFNAMYGYIRSDPRFMDIKKQRRQVIFTWVKREYKNLLIARNAGVRVPAPITFLNHMIVMELVGESRVAPQLKDAWPKDPKAFLDDIIDNIRKLYHAGIVHADLSEFNILNLREKPVIIDMSQGTSTKDPDSKRYLKRDLRNMKRFFTKLGMVPDADEIYRKIIS